jgi:putative flippase GtrA
MNSNRAIFVRWLKFNFVGAIGVGVQLATLTVLAGVLHFHYLFATTLAVEAALIHNFIWHERYTWADRRTQAAATRFATFNATNGALSIVGNLVTMKLLVEGANIPYLLANILAIATCSTANFLVSDRCVFRAIPRAGSNRG